MNACEVRCAVYTFVHSSPQHWSLHAALTNTTQVTKLRLATLEVPNSYNNMSVGHHVCQNPYHHERLGHTERCLHVLPCHATKRSSHMFEKPGTHASRRCSCHFQCRCGIFFSSACMCSQWMPQHGTPVFRAAPVLRAALQPSPQTTSQEIRLFEEYETSNCPRCWRWTFPSISFHKPVCAGLRSCPFRWSMISACFLDCFFFENMRKFSNSPRSIWYSLNSEVDLETSLKSATGFPM